MKIKLYSAPFPHPVPEYSRNIYICYGIFFLYFRNKICRNLFHTVTAVLHNKHEDGEGENQDNLRDGARDGRAGQLSPLHHVTDSVEGLGDEFHGHVVDEWDNSLELRLNSDFVRVSISKEN